MDQIKEELLKNIDIIARELKKGNDISIKTNKTGLKISRVEVIK
jgi:hypothetical protein